MKSPAAEPPTTQTGPPSAFFCVFLDPCRLHFPATWCTANLGALAQFKRAEYLAGRGRVWHSLSLQCDEPQPIDTSSESSLTEQYSGTESLGKIQPSIQILVFERVHSFERWVHFDSFLKIHACVDTFSERNSDPSN